MAADEVAGRTGSRYLRFGVRCLGLLLPVAIVTAAMAAPGTLLDVRVVEVPRHEGSPGRSLIRLLSRADSSVISRDTVEGIWYRIGYDSARARYLLGGAFEIGAWLPVRSVAFLDEGTGRLAYSRFGEEGWFAMAMTARPDGRYIAFVGGREDDAAMRLAVLDTQADVVAVAGRAPAPPPLASANEREFFRSAQGGYQWGSPPWDGFVTMDAGIILFDGSGDLVARYGADAATHRASRRISRRWRIAKLFPK
ncbi:MAG TPA: hypothetical protein VHI13_12010 [Candidatus Kapabacteria bacterium]|nr:hypothetical protein [Candidatus Kapabacteria bacterium]